MDWELIAVVAFLICAGLIVVIVCMLGLTRTEKSLGAAYVVGFASLLCVINLPDGFAMPVLQTDGDVVTWKAEIDTWTARIDTVHQLCMGMIWLTVAAGIAFLFVAATHIWRERAKLVDKLKVEL